MKKKNLNIKARLKVHLLLGKAISHNTAQKKWKTNRLASYIHRLKDEFRSIGLEISCMIVTHDGHQYGVYRAYKIRK